jgi:hypothetical protein
MWDTLVSQSTITQRESYPHWLLSKPMIKSMSISSHFYSGTRKGCNTPAGHWCSALTLWQVSQKGNILSNISLHSVPPIGCLDIMVHLIHSWVNGIGRVMGLLKYLILQFLNIRPTNPSFVPQYSFIIFLKFRWFLLLDIALYLLDLLVDLSIYPRVE